MEKQLDPEKKLEDLALELPKFEQLAEKEFDANTVKTELEKLSKEELVELQINMFAQYHQMAKAIVDLTAALKAAL